MKIKKSCKRSFRLLLPCLIPFLALAIIVLTGVLFVAFTFWTPQIPLFRDPLSGSYGIGG